MSNLSVSLLGSFEATLVKRPLSPFRTKSVQALLIYLLCEANQAHQREALMTLLWPDLPLLSAQANMRQTVYRLRKMLPDVKGKDSETAVPFIISTRQTIQINPDADYFLDVDAFEASDPAQAITLYRGDFLADFYLPDSEPFEEWVNSRRAHYRRRVLEMLEGETAVHLQSHNYDKAIQLAQRQLEIDNLRESSHRQLMEAWARNGRRQDALSHYQTLQKLLQDELAIEPESETTTLIDAIRAGELSKSTFISAQQPSEFNQPKHNLPQQLSSFIGRDKEIETVVDLLKQHQLVMLTGVGGIGKTNLSLQVGRKLVDSFPDGVWLVELAPLADPALIAQTAVSALDLPDSPNQPPLQTVRNYLQEKSCLLILDNCEHLINGAAQFAQTLLQHCPDLKILASSREALGVPGEMPFHVPPLSIPEASQTPSLDEWQQYEAMRLFVERATAVLPHFQVTAGNITPLMQICRQLDGIPLALELAAARVKMLTIAQIAERLNDRFRLLTGGKRTALPRQQTLRALIDWSWELLTESEQLLLQRLSVFAGGMDLEAMEAVCVGDGLDAYDILDLSAELVNKSLLVSLREQGKRPRYHLLETIRQYGQERLFRAEQGDRLRQQHLDYYWQLGQQAEQALVGPDQVAWLDRLDKEWDNFRAALNWAMEADIEKGAELVSNTANLWHGRGSISEADAWLTQLLASSEQIKPAIRAKALVTLGRINKDRFKPHHARQLLEESLSIYQLLEDSNGIAHCLLHLAHIADGQGERNKAQNLFSNSLSIYRQLEDKLGLADLLFLFGTFYGNALNEYGQATAYIQESYSLFKELEHLHGIAFASAGLGQLAMRQGDYKTAQMWLEEGLEYQDSLEDKLSGGWISNILGQLYIRLKAYDKAQHYLEKSNLISKQSGQNIIYYWGLIFLGYCFLWQDELEKAETTLLESQQLFKNNGAISGVIPATEGLAFLAIRRQNPKLAVRLLAWADATRAAIHDPRPPVEQADVDRETKTILEMIDEESYTTAYEEGKAMTIEQVIGSTPNSTVS